MKFYGLSPYDEYDWLIEEGETDYVIPSLRLAKLAARFIKWWYQAHAVEVHEGSDKFEDGHREYYRKVWEL